MEREAEEEISRLLAELGDRSPVVSRTGISGVLEVETAVLPQQVAGHIREKVGAEPWSVRYVLRVIPVDRMVPTRVGEIVSACSGYRSVMESNTYRVTVEKRHSVVSSAEIISGIADAMQGQVSLERPTWQIVVEVLGEKTGVALVRAEDVVSVPKLKRNMH